MIKVIAAVRVFVTEKLLEAAIKAYPYKSGKKRLRQKVDSFCFWLGLSGGAG